MMPGLEEMMGKKDKPADTNKEPKTPIVQGVGDWYVSRMAPDTNGVVNMLLANNQNAETLAARATLSKALSSGPLSAIAASNEMAKDALNQPAYDKAGQDQLRESLHQARQNLEAALSDPVAIGRDIIQSLKQNEGEFNHLVEQYAKNKGIDVSDTAKKDEAKHRFETEIMTIAAQQAAAELDHQQRMLARAFSAKLQDEQLNSDTNSALVSRITGEDGQVVVGKAKLKPGNYEFGAGYNKSKFTVNEDGSVKGGNPEIESNRDKMLEIARAQCNPGDSYTINLTLEKATIGSGERLASQQKEIYTDYKLKSTGLHRYTGDTSAAKLAELQNRYAKNGYDPKNPDKEIAALLKAHREAQMRGEKPLNLTVTGHNLTVQEQASVDNKAGELNAMRQFAERVSRDMTPGRDYRPQHAQEQQTTATFTPGN